MNNTHRKTMVTQFLEDMQAIRHRVFSKINISSGLPVSQMVVLHLVEEHEGIGIKELSRFLGITSSGVTQLVNSLVKKGYLSRQDSANDRRALQISLTDKYKVEVTELKRLQMKRMGALFDVFSDEELEQYIALNKKMINGLRNKEGKGVDAGKRTFSSHRPC